MVNFTPKGLILPDLNEFVKVEQLNANLDRISEIGVGASPVLSTERPNFGTIDDEVGSIIMETDTFGAYVRRNGNSSGAVGIGNVGANWRAVMPGTWRDWSANNPWSGWLTGNNNTRVARYMPFGRMALVHLEAVIGTGGDITAGPSIGGGLPLGDDTISEAGYGGDALGSGPWPVGDATAIISGDVYFGRVILNSSNISVRGVPTSASSAASTWSSTVPANWGVGDSISLDFLYFTT